MNIIELGFFDLFFIALRWYPLSEGWKQFGPRKLGMWRWAFDLGPIAILVERYWR